MRIKNPGITYKDLGHYRTSLPGCSCVWRHNKGNKTLILISWCGKYGHVAKYTYNHVPRKLPSGWVLLDDV